MEVLMPSAPLDSNVLSECRDQIDFDDFFLAKLAFINTNSDLDVFQLQGEERIQHLLCAWDTAYILCRRCENERRSLPDFLKNFIANLVHYSMSLWFSLEWELCDFSLCCSLLVSMFRLRPKLLDIPCLAKLNWSTVMNIGIRPWQALYFKDYMRTWESDNNTNPSAVMFSVETTEPPATLIDIAHIESEGYILTLLRLRKLFDAGCMKSVKRLSILAISTWNQEQQEVLESCDNSTAINYDEDLKRCLNMICHTHLMAVFERDTAIGFEIDNMINNIRFYYKCICDAQIAGKSIRSFIQQTHVTPSYLLAITCFRLNQSVQDFIESAIPDLSRENCITLFGAVSHAYATYLLASVLVEMNKFNTGDFIANLDKYKKTMRAYVVERERSERFILDGLHNQKLQRTSHNVNCTVKEIANLKASIGKGNHSSNLVNHKPTDVQSEQERVELFETENEKRYDPVFQTMPNNEIVTNEFYDVLSKSNYKGWLFAKLVLLLKIIGRELNDIEKWCYHPGLSTQFMMTLECRLAERFADLALILKDHIFMEQEFWLTAFYLQPARIYYEKVIYSGTRFHRTVNFLNKGDREEIILKPTDKSADKAKEVSCAFMNAKYGLLSSTFDVKQIAQMTCVDTAENDYDLLAKALRMLRLPENIIKDLLTVTFSPRHANFTWAAEWPILRKRCKMLLTTPAYKCGLVESNMAEANDRLKYLKVDYDKYKDWPQIDYGTIEEGYENDYIGEDFEDTDIDDDYDDDTNKKNGCTKKFQINEKFGVESDDPENKSIDMLHQDHMNELEFSGSLKRSSARRAAAVIASALFKEEPTTKFVKKKDDASKPVPLIVAKEETNSIVDNQQAQFNALFDDGFIDSAMQLENEIVNFSNSTEGFIPITDIWINSKHDRNPSQLSEHESSAATSDFLSKMSNLCRIVNNNDEGDALSRSETESFDDQQSIHDAMNVSDSESSNSSSEDNEGHGWEKLLPSFIVENSLQANKLMTSENVKQVEFETETVSKNENDYENDIELETENVQEIDNEVYAQNDSKNATNKDNESDYLCSSVSENLRINSEESQTESTHCDNNLASVEAKSDENVQPVSSETVSPSHFLIQSVEIFSASLCGKLNHIEYQENPASLVIAVAPADCTDTLLQNSPHIEVKSINENFKDEEFVVSTTTMTSSSTTQEASDLVDHDETEETTIDSTACSKTEDHESIDEGASIETVTEDSTGHVPKIETEKVEVHSTTEIDSFDKKLTGKPKSFSAILSAQLLSDDSTSQSSSGTQPHSIKREGSMHSSETVDSEMEEKRKAELVQLCLHRKCCVQLENVMNMKNALLKLEPIVRVKRVNLDKFYEEKATRQKRTSTKPKNFYMEENTSPTPHSNPRPRKRRYDSTTGSESDEEYKPKTAKESARSTSRRLPMTKKAFLEKQLENRSKNFSVVPRSASGLKMCISSLCDNRPPNDCIEISSSSEADIMDAPPYPVEFANIDSIIMEEVDPLFEEEADIDLLR